MIALLPLVGLLQAKPAYFPVTMHSKFFVIAYENEPEGLVSFPLPRDYRGQVPSGFQLKSKPKDAVASSRIYFTPTGDTVAELHLKPLRKEKRIEIEWTSQVIVDMGEEFQHVAQTAPFPEVFPAEAAQWLKPSKYVQSDDAKIIAKAREFKKDTVYETIRAINVGCNLIMTNQKGQATELSSVTALTTRGSCTSSANLMTALLRANGVPARLLSGCPTWAKAPYQTHYIVEAYLPEFGWFPIDPTLSAAGWNCAMMPIFSISSVENENKGVMRLSGAAGVPYMSLTETTGSIVARGLLSKQFADHEAKLDLNTHIDPAAAEAAHARWAEWLESSKSGIVDLPNTP